MDFFNSAFGQETQKTLGDYARYAKGLKSGSGVNGNGVDATDNNKGTENSQKSQMMMMMMMFMMLLSQMGGKSIPPDLLSKLPLPFLPGLPGGMPFKPQTPAMTALETRFSKKATEQDPKATTIQFTDSDVDAIKAELKAGTYTREELGQTLMYQLAAGPDKFQAGVQKIIQNLCDTGDLNPTAFLQAEYLKQLPETRKDVLLSALGGAGLTLQNNQPNTRLIGYMLETLGRPDNSESKAFIQKLLQKIQTDSGQSSDSVQGPLLTQILQLAGIKANAQGILTFP